MSRTPPPKDRQCGLRNVAAPLFGATFSDRVTPTLSRYSISEGTCEASLRVALTTCYLCLMSSLRFRGRTRREFARVSSPGCNDPRTGSKFVFRLTPVSLLNGTAAPEGQPPGAERPRPAARYCPDAARRTRPDWMRRPRSGRGAASVTVELRDVRPPPPPRRARRRSS